MEILIFFSVIIGIANFIILVSVLKNQVYIVSRIKQLKQER